MPRGDDAGTMTEWLPLPPEGLLLANASVSREEVVPSTRGRLRRLHRRRIMLKNQRPE